MYPPYYWVKAAPYYFQVMSALPQSRQAILTFDRLVLMYQKTALLRYQTTVLRMGGGGGVLDRR